jgi:hypothetical protein
MDAPGVWREVVNTAKPGIREAGPSGVTLVGHSVVLLAFAERGQDAAVEGRRGRGSHGR